MERRCLNPCQACYMQKSDCHGRCRGRCLFSVGVSCSNSLHCSIHNCWCFRLGWRESRERSKAASNRRKPFRPAIRGFACPRQVACPTISRVNSNSKATFPSPLVVNGGGSGLVGRGAMLAEMEQRDGCRLEHSRFWLILSPTAILAGPFSCPVGRRFLLLQYPRGSYFSFAWPFGCSVGVSLRLHAWLHVHVQHRWCITTAAD